MLHPHTHHNHNIEETGVQNLFIAFILNLLFTVIEIIGGILTNSVAILSDALHDLGDSLSLGLALYFQKLSGKSRDEKFTYGYKRFSLLGAITNATIIACGSVFILLEAIPRLFNPEYANPKGMLYLALLGILVNGIAVFRLRSSKNINIKFAMLHLMEDVLGWVAILIGSVIMMFFDIPIIDPILSIAITSYVVFRIFGNIKQTIKIILQGIPSKDMLHDVKSYLRSKPEIIGFHDLHIWSLDGQYHILTTHLVIDEPHEIEAQENLKKKIRNGLNQLGINHCTLEIESPATACEYDS